MSCLGDLERGRGDLWHVNLAVDLACFHGKTFWRVCLAGLFGGSSWLIHLAGFQSNEIDMLLSKKRNRKVMKCIMVNL